MSSEHQYLSNHAGTQESEVDNLQSKLQQDRSNLLKARELLAHAEQKHHTQSGDADARIQHLEAAIAKCREENTALQFRYDLLLNSTIWRLSAPIRSVVDAVPPGMRLQARRMLKLLYWIVSAYELRHRIAFRKARNAGQLKVPPSATVESFIIVETPPAATLSDPLNEMPAGSALPPAIVESVTNVETPPAATLFDPLNEMPAGSAALALGKFQDIGQEHVRARYF